jgi:hypothetical protein
VSSLFEIPSGVLLRAQQVGAAIEHGVTALGGKPIEVDAWQIISGRAALLGLGPPSRISSGGATRLLSSADGWCALTLIRQDDFESVPALLEGHETDARSREEDSTDDLWDAVAAVARNRRGADFVARARLLDMPAATLGETTPSEPTVTPYGTPAHTSIADVLVVDLSSMWAGPLCTRLLAAAGATVVKVETPARPDGTRVGNPGFFDWLNSEKLCCAIDFNSDELTRLLRAADVVIEGSRPSALARRGQGAEQVRPRPGRVWVRISGYGSAHPDRVAFGDVAAVAGGLVMPGPAFCGDAIADPLTGLAAADAILGALTSGGGAIIDVSMAGVAGLYATLPSLPVHRGQPRAPSPPVRAHALGADTRRVADVVEARLGAGC